MANHVNNYLSIHQISDEGRKVWQEVFLDRMQDPAQRVFDLREFFFDVDDEGNYINFEWEVVAENIGAKWASVEDGHEDGLNVCSAWSPIVPFAEYVAKIIGEVDPDVQLVLTYEDEMPNFVGVATFTAEGLYTDNEIEWDDIRDQIINDNDDIRELWDAEEEDWHEGKEDEGNELIWEVQWDTINDWQMDNTEWSIK